MLNPAGISRQPASLQEGLQEVLVHACQQVQVSAGLILWEEAGFLHPVARLGLAEAALPPAPLRAEPGQIPADYLAALGEAMPTWAAWPLHWQEQTIGWLLLGGAGREPAFAVAPEARERYARLVTLLLIAWEEVSRREERLRAAEASSRQAEKRAALLRAIGEVSRQVLTLLKPEALLQSAVESLVHNMGYDFANVLLRQGDELVVRASAGKSSATRVGGTFPLTQGITGLVTRTCQPYLSNDVQKDAFYLYSADWSQTRAELTVPIRSATEVCGVLDVQSLACGAFDEADMLALASLADQLGIALENAQLLESLHQRMAELELAQSRLSQAEKLSALGELIANTAHELNNPLTSVIGYAQLVQAAVQDPAVLRDMAVIVQAAQRAAHIVEDLLLFARQRDPDFRAVDVNALLQQTLALHFAHLAAEGITVDLLPAPNLPLVRADPTQLEQVFTNLIQNARESFLAGPAERRVTLRTFCPATGTRPGTWVRIEVADNGPGIPEEALLRVFDPFFTTREDAGATGMGLSICYGIVVRHGGLIWAEGEAEQGARFCVELPAWYEETDWSKEAVI